MQAGRLLYPLDYNRLRDMRFYYLSFTLKLPVIGSEF